MAVAQNSRNISSLGIPTMMHFAAPLSSGSLVPMAIGDCLNARGFCPMRTIDIDASTTFSSPGAGPPLQNGDWTRINHCDGSFDMDLSTAKELAEWLNSQLEPGVTELSRACETSIGTIALKFSVGAACSFVRTYRSTRRPKAR
jgi:hypothetical protein